MRRMSKMAGGYRSGGARNVTRLDKLQANFNRAQSFASIATKERVTSDMIASFLRLPHATMPNYPLSRKDAQDIAAFIVEMKRVASVTGPRALPTTYPLHFSRLYPSRMATALVQPADARSIFTGKQDTVKPVEGNCSRLCSFSMWQ